MHRTLPVCVLLALVGGLFAAEGEPAPAAETPAAEEPAEQPAAEAEAPVAQPEAAAAAPAEGQDPAAWNVRQKASYLFGFAQLGPAVQQGKLLPGVVISGIEDSVGGVEAKVPLAGAQALYQEWQAQLEQVEGAGDDRLAANVDDWSDRQKISYLFGYMPLSQTVKEGKLDVATLSSGLRDGFAGVEAKVGVEQMQEVFMAYDQTLQEEAAEAAKANRAKGQDYLAAKAAAEGVTATPSGLLYEVLKAGDGPQPGPGDTVRVHYTGTLIDGTVFDSSEQRGEPATFGVGGVIAGWTEALQLMKVGSRYRLHIPPELGYGERGAGGDIPPGAVLVFEVELLGIE